ncbi:MAG: ribonuclease HI family protein [Candidatus Paceibacterota bacterium]|jgi:ribonuclease HI
MKILIHTDGGSRGNPGKAAVGVVIEGVGKEPIRIGKKIGIKTNNEAEYLAVFTALEEIVARRIAGIDSIECVMDSLLVVSQLSGTFKIKQAHLKALLDSVKRLEKAIGVPISYRHVMRENNKEADKLVNEALDKS